MQAARSTLLAVASPSRLDIGGLQLAPRGLRIEKDVEHAGGGAELQLACIAFRHVEPGRTELALKLIGTTADHAFGPGAT